MTRSEAGFTLIEAVVAAGLLVALSLGTARLFAIVVQQHAMARQQLVMGLLASAKIDELSAAIANGSAAETSGDTLDRTVDAASDAIVESGRRYVRRWRLTQAPGYGGDAWTIVVRVLPSAGGGDVRVATVRMAGAS